MSLLSRHLDPIPALKAQVAGVLVERLRGFTCEIAGGRLKLAPQRIGDLRRGRLDDFSLQRLVRCLHRLGDQIEITVVRSDEVWAREARAETARRAALIAADRERIERLREKRRQARRNRGGRAP